MLEKLFGLPAHPVYVHFPIAFFIFSSILLVLYRLEGPSQRVSRLLKKIKLGSYDLESLSFFLLFLGLGTVLPAILSGLALVGGWAHAPSPHAPLGVGATFCYFTALVLRWVFGPTVHTRPVRYFYYSLHLLGFVLVALTGYEGGELHYR